MALSLQRYTWSDFGSGLNHMLKERAQKQGESSAVIAIKIGDAVPENVIVEILSWLPVKALLQFKCVCKPWYAVISSPDFISKHLRNYYRNNDGDSHCILAQYYVSQAELQLFELLVDETPRVLGHEVLYGMPMYGSHICGPCDGLYYLYNYNSQERALWNPAINELKPLPPLITKPSLPSDLTYAVSEAFGFGFDLVTNDYKVVVIKGYWSTTDDESETSHPLSVLIYSLRTDSWRYWGDLAQDYQLEKSKCYTLVNDCFYWLGSCDQYENPEVIVSFDLANDASQEIRVPDYDQPASNALGVYDNSLAFLSVHENEKRFDIWTWNGGFWTKKFTMGPIPDVRNPIGHWKNNKFLLEDDDCRLVLCDPETQEIKDLGFQGDRWCEAVFVYKESLASVKESSRRGCNEESDETDTIPQV